MKQLNSRELREIFFDFFKEKGHTLIPTASLIPENDPSVLFTTAGMHPLVPFLLGEKHPAGARLVNVQKCLRTVDIDSVGDSSHLTYFEMLGNWSLGDYFKKEAITWSYEFLTSEKYLNIDKEKLYFSVFAGNDSVPKDEESYNIWRSIGIDEDHIFYLGEKENFWILGSGVGPCGPDTEMFYDTGKEKCSSTCDPSCSCGKYLEIWNNVFMQYKMTEENKIIELAKPNVDTGMGLERVLCVLNGLTSVYESELFIGIRNQIEKLTNTKYDSDKQSYRIIMDHIRTATFILGDYQGIAPSNNGAGYVLRRLIRRAIRYLKKISDITDILPELAKVIVEEYQDVYPELANNKDFIYDELEKEEKKFNNTLKDGERHFKKVIKKVEGNIIPGSEAFKLFDTFGFPLEMTIELAKENDLEVDIEGFNEAFKLHQEKSKTLDAGSYKGGLADDSEQTIKYHTLAHIILAVLQDMFGKDIIQKGSNITRERLRFDFTLDHKMTEEEKQTLTNKVNEYIDQDLPVIMEEMSISQAKEVGAHGSFENKYGDFVKVYTIGDNLSKEICGGPHVEHTGVLGTFKIKKEESSSSGVRRIKAVLE